MRLLTRLPVLSLTLVGVVGLGTNNARLVDLAFDVLALEALFMVPRVFSILSLSPYWGVSYTHVRYTLRRS